jgi:Glu-tRNA(Gln) amidotransferase subunit E-like FAD-binding protein
MYPDTDTPPLPIPDALVAEIRERARATPWQRERRYEKLGLSFAAARQLAAAPWADLFDELDPAPGDTARRVGNTLANRIPYHLRRGAIRDMPHPGRLAPLVRAMEAGEIRAEAAGRVVDELLQRADTPVAEILSRYRARSDQLERLEAALAAVVEQAGGLRRKTVDSMIRWCMGEVMRQFLGSVDPRLVRQRLARELAAAEPGVTA